MTSRTANFYKGNECGRSACIRRGTALGVCGAAEPRAGVTSVCARLSAIIHALKVGVAVDAVTASLKEGSGAMINKQSAPLPRLTDFAFAERMVTTSPLTVLDCVIAATVDCGINPYGRMVRWIWRLRAKCKVRP